MIKYADLTFRMGYFQCFVFQLFGGNSGYFSLRFILNSDSGLYFINKLESLTNLVCTCA